MSRKKRRKKNRQPGNIKDDPVYNPFPKSGLVKQFEPYIRKVVRQFSGHYPNIAHEAFLFRAVELAFAAEKTFQPERGISFATYLGGFEQGGRLKELHRLHDDEEKHQGVPIYRTKEDLAHEKAEEEGEPTDDVKFGGGGNGIRLVFDLQWWEALLSPFIRYFDHPGPIGQFTSEMPKAQKVHRLKLGLQLHSSVSGTDVHQRISADLPNVIKQQPPEPFLAGWIRGFIDHAVRRQREADDEARKRSEGDHSPTFLEAARNWIDVKFYKGRRSPRFLAKYLGFVRLDDHYSSNDGEWQRSYHDTVVGIADGMSSEQERRMWLDAATEARRGRTNKNEIAMLDALEARIRGEKAGTLSDIAKETGITKGAASKIAQRLRLKAK